MFSMFLFFLCWWHLIGVFGVDEVKSVPEGDSVTLHTDVGQIHEDDDILWKYGNENSLIAKITRKKPIFPDGRFRDRLKLDDQTGSLTITNTTTKDAGDYEVEISGEKHSTKAFRVSVYAHLPVPVIIRNSSQCFSSSCSVVCSVVNVSHVNLSWLKGNGLLSSISVSDLSISLSLPLEVEDQDTNNYSCVLNNSITHQTTHLNISGVCQTCEDSVYCCGSTEALIRLVLSALVGVATVFVLVYDTVQKS